MQTAGQTVDAKIARLQQTAAELGDDDGLQWSEVFDRLLGPGGVVRVLSPSEREAWIASPAIDHLLGQVATLRRRDRGSRRAATKRIVTLPIRLPRVIHLYLLHEASINRTSLNSLCTGKLLRPALAIEIERLPHLADDDDGFPGSIADQSAEIGR